MKDVMNLEEDVYMRLTDDLSKLLLDIGESYHPHRGEEIEATPCTRSVNFQYHGGSYTKCGKPFLNSYVISKRVNSLCHEIKMGTPDMYLKCIPIIVLTLNQYAM